MRRGPEPHDLWAERDEPVVGVGGLVVEGGVYGHGRGDG